ncbi:hypothetical protein AO392_23700 [Pseudomonas putida]|nr:hypothetical protein AO392_23700 [Pseudomonas putida]OOV95949.1 hypothetical protein MF6396_21940 [Pseudomonas sp. MF6396]
MSHAQEKAQRRLGFIHDLGLAEKFLSTMLLRASRVCSEERLLGLSSLYLVFSTFREVIYGS